MKEEAVANFINQYLIYYKTIDDGHKSKAAKLCGDLLTFIAVMGKVLQPMCISLAILKPELPTHLSSLSCPTSSLSVLARITSIIPFVYVMLTWWSNMHFLGTAMLVYIFCVLATLQDLQYVICELS